jgi:hypothetical protein
MAEEATLALLDYGFGVWEELESARGIASPRRPQLIDWVGRSPDVEQLDEPGRRRLYWLCTVRYAERYPGVRGPSVALMHLFFAELRRFAADYPLTEEGWSHPLDPPPDSNEGWKAFISQTIQQAHDAAQAPS